MATNDILTQNKETTPVSLGQRLLTGAKETVKKALGTALLSGLGGALAGSLGGFFAGDFARDTFDSAIDSDGFSHPAIKETLENLNIDIGQHADKFKALKDTLKESTESLPKLAAAGGALIGTASGTAAGAVGGAAYGAIKGTFWADKIKAEREMAEQAKANGQSNGIA